ncbi:MAG: DUF4214 domain-containing protein [Cellulomonadaceae bacterium]|nr:DUF4214 domain-containing protein [Cellulomonadaceae bacterium]
MSTAAPAAGDHYNFGSTRAQDLVVAIYQDLFGRLPSATEGLYWGNRLFFTESPGGEQRRGDVAQAITSSDEYRSSMIAGAYDAYLLRGPDGGGMAFWLGRMDAGVRIEEIDAGFIASQEYWNRAGATPDGWVQMLYTDVLGRPAQPTEVRYWVGRLAAGASRGWVATGFLLSTEHLGAVVSDYYDLLLERAPDTAGLSYWVTAIQGGARDEAIVGLLVSSQEYWDLAVGPVFDSMVFESDYVVARPGESVAFRILGYLGGVYVGDVQTHVRLYLEGQRCAPGVCVVPLHSGQIVHVFADKGSLIIWAMVDVIGATP